MNCQLFTIFMLVIVGEVVNGSNIDLLAKASTEFSQKLYRQVALNPENVAYSPLSIHLSLSLTWYGARGTTASQMENALSMGRLGSLAHRAYRDLIVQMNSFKGVDLYAGNALYLNPRVHIQPDFLKEAKEEYFTQVANFDSEAPGGPEKPINLYVKEKTNGIIEKMLPSNSINGSTVMVILNSLVFNGTWYTQFKKHKTRRQDFYKLKSVTTQVDMMREEMDVYLKKDNENGRVILQLPFKNRRFGLYIVLPKEVDGIVELENQLQVPHKVAEIFNDLTLTHVAVTIPKFKIETTMSLEDALQKLGMTEAFSSGYADFKGISPVEVYISKVLHKSVFEIMETGTVAATATALIRTSLPANATVEYSFTADRPFLFFVRDNESKQILFQGKFCG